MNIISVKIIKLAYLLNKHYEKIRQDIIVKIISFIQGGIIGAQNIPLII